MKSVVTGGAGFIGSNLAEALLADRQEVHIIDDLSTGHRHNIPEGATFHEGSVLDIPLLKRVFKDTDVVYHQGALGSVPRSIENPARSHDVNVNGTFNVLDTARTCGVQKVVYAASSSAYGDTPTLPKVEDMPPNPKSPYAVTKLTGELYCRTFFETYGLRTTALRYFNVYGPRQDPEGAYAAVIPKFILAAMAGKDLTIHGDGEQSRDFTYVADVVEANRLAARSTKADGMMMNIGAGGRTTVNELARAIIDAVGSLSSVVHGPVRGGDVAHSLAGLERAAKAIGYAPAYDMEAGLAATVEWFIKAHATPNSESLAPRSST